MLHWWKTSLQAQKDKERTRSQTALGYAGDACSAAGLFPLPFDGPFAGPFPGPLAATAGACQHADTETLKLTMSLCQTKVD